MLIGKYIRGDSLKHIGVVNVSNDGFNSDKYLLKNNILKKKKTNEINLASNCIVYL